MRSLLFIDPQICDLSKPSNRNIYAYADYPEAVPRGSEHLEAILRAHL